MKSHLPEPVLKALTRVVRELEEGFQSKTHLITQVMQADDAFDEKYIESHLTRALLCGVVQSIGGIEVVELPNGGCEICIRHGNAAWRFRFRRARRNARNGLEVTVSSDSIFAHQVYYRRSLFEQEPAEAAAVDAETLWVLAYIVSPKTRTLQEAWALKPVGFLNDTPPFKLLFEDPVEIAFAPPPPPSFPGTSDDLDLREDDEGGEEEQGRGQPG